MAWLPLEDTIVRVPLKSRSRFCISDATSSLVWCSKNCTKREVRVWSLRMWTERIDTHHTDVWQELAIVTTPDIKVGRRGSKLAICE